MTNYNRNSNLTNLLEIGRTKQASISSVNFIPPHNLPNTNNTCFLSSAIQLLYRNEELVKFIHKNYSVLISQYLSTDGKNHMRKFLDLIIDTLNKNIIYE